MACNKHVTIRTFAMVLIQRSVCPPPDLGTFITQAVGELWRRVQFMGSEQERKMTADECEELADALAEDAAALSLGPKKQETSNLAHCYRSLAQMKRLVLRKVN